MGTENAAWFLYSLVRMLRPRRLLEVGLGYTTPFLLQALADNVAEADDDRRCTDAGVANDARGTVLNPAWPREYAPQLVAIDDFSNSASSAPHVLQVVRELGLECHLQLQRGDFRGQAARAAGERGAFDLVWFDCGGPPDYVDFLEEYWPFVSAEGGVLALHYTYWSFPAMATRRDGTKAQAEVLMPGSILNEIKRQQARLGPASMFETLTVVEPHKSRQGSVTLIRRLPALSRCRETSMQDELSRVRGEAFIRGFTLG
jgi:predicted O-methyltransferase YrrM